MQGLICSGALAGKIGKYLLGLSHGQVVQVNLLLGRVFASERVAIKRLFIAQLRKLKLNAILLRRQGLHARRFGQRLNCFVQGMPCPLRV